MKKTQFKTYDNSTAPIKDNITKTSFKMTFSKSNFMFIGKWIIAFVLIIVLGSQALNGFISSKFTKDSTTETIVHEYRKQVGVEVTGGNFDFVDSLEDLQLLLDKKIYIKYYDSISDIQLTIDSFPSTTKYYFMLLNYHSSAGNKYINYYNDNDELVSRYSVASSSDGVRFGALSWRNSHNIFLLNSNSVNYYSMYNFNDSLVNHYYSYSYFIIPSEYWYFQGINSSFNYSHIRLFLNTFFTYGEIVEVPIYETTTYTYEVRDNNYNWDTKLKQLSSFKPLFKFNQSFINEEYLKYNNLISYEYVDTSASRELLVERYKSDERLKPLFDNNYLIVSGKSETGLFKDKTKLYSFLKFNGNLDFDIEGVSSAYNWVIDNYVTDFNIDSYLKESKYKVELKDILEIFTFPIQIMNNIVYNFGVLIGFITWW